MGDYNGGLRRARASRVIKFSQKMKRVRVSLHVILFSFIINS